MGRALTLGDAVEIHHAVRDVVDRVGPGLLQDAESFRGVLDDVLDEDDAEVGDVNLLVDAVRFGAVDQLVRLLDSDADPALAASTVGAGFARQRGGADVHSASWACAVLAFAVGRVPDDVVRDLAARCASADTEATTPHAPPTAVSPTPTLIINEGVAERVTETGSHPRSRRRIALLVGATAVGVVGAGIAVALALDGRTTPDAVGKDSADQSGAASSQGTGAQCWDGEPAATVAGCSAPTDVAGLAWVFPASDDDACEAEGPGQATKVVQRYCPMALADGGDVQIHYSQWRDYDWMADHYEAERLAEDFGVGRSDLAAFAVEAPDRLQKVVLFYLDADAPFAVTVYADSKPDLYAAVGLLMIRAHDQLRGLAPGQDELPASFVVEPSLAPS
jgi:hypothetical protein